ncbi:MAG: bifunctional 5,10-methylenetetrahydrofolate dehydrogenase/5,10-methenyltetrahydrofolate cyclohydrolase [Bdellovibrionales bacterium]|nr:bifunctional 5,10-methylenetetrahydrofolate dehydrogenase/5,10-methenyltetrahydrofolate cyclohydrolase [Bdellovibrionales bacterium]
MSLILDGKIVAQSVYGRMAEEIAALPIRPKLSVVLVGEDPASQTYVKSKAARCEQLGLQSETVRLPATVLENELYAVLETLNEDVSVHGILVQLPLPAHLSKYDVARRISAMKDVDGLHPENAGLLSQGRPRFAPCTPAGVVEMLDFYKIPVDGRHAVVIGRSEIVGKPAAQLLLQRNATVTICHSRTQSIENVAALADILVVAMGKPQAVDRNWVKPGATVIDVGIHRVAGKLVGDVHTESVQEVASAVSPVPGGVGPMTIAMLMQNVVRAAGLQYPRSN